MAVQLHRSVPGFAGARCPARVRASPTGAAIRVRPEELQRQVGVDA